MSNSRRRGLADARMREGPVEAMPVPIKGYTPAGRCVPA
ncbi:hypothetical protein CP97_14787 [Aurantiacibacter atlanticus]|uniref:Uncharacterized protein n=1 Tax=Aurantiacibacter atlanticus TaxID=1648404 RepID=A0A168M2G5_9SPHN|nr:hypothetical protein CP97_14787 [Aurantiacibacter atlanticus]